MQYPLVQLFMQLQNSWRKGALSMRAPKGGGRRTKISSKSFISYIADKIFLESQAVVK